MNKGGGAQHDEKATRMQKRTMTEATGLVGDGEDDQKMRDNKDNELVRDGGDNGTTTK